MKDPHQKEKLDQLLDDTLKALPMRHAPDDFLSSVMMQVEAHEAKRLNPALRWPVTVLGLILATGLSYYGKVIILILRNLLGIKTLEDSVGAFSRVFEVIGSVCTALLQGVANIPSSYLIAGALGLVFILFTSCLSAGTLLYRLSSFSHAHPYES